jgi:biotin-(acetyl-CoA carboxylase) ligase
LETLKTIEKHDNLKLSYEKNLFSLGKPRMFESGGKQFMGIIRGVNDSHQLRVEREDETVGLYDHAQIKMML